MKIEKILHGSHHFCKWHHNHLIKYAKMKKKKCICRCTPIIMFICTLYYQLANISCIFLQIENLYLSLKTTEWIKMAAPRITFKNTLNTNIFHISQTIFISKLLMVCKRSVKNLNRLGSRWHAIANPHASGRNALVPHSIV